MLDQNKYNNILIFIILYFLKYFQNLMYINKRINYKTYLLSIYYKIKEK